MPPRTAGREALPWHPTAPLPRTRRTARPAQGDKARGKCPIQPHTQNGKQGKVFAVQPSVLRRDGKAGGGYISRRCPKAEAATEPQPTPQLRTKRGAARPTASGWQAREGRCAAHTPGRRTGQAGMDALSHCPQRAASKPQYPHARKPQHPTGPKRQAREGSCAAPYTERGRGQMHYPIAPKNKDSYQAAAPASHGGEAAARPTASKRQAWEGRCAAYTP